MDLAGINFSNLLQLLILFILKCAMNLILVVQFVVRMGLFAELITLKQGITV